LGPVTFTGVFPILEQLAFSTVSVSVPLVTVTVAALAGEVKVTTMPEVVPVPLPTLATIVYPLAPIGTLGNVKVLPDPVEPLAEYEPGPVRVRLAPVSATPFWSFTVTAIEPLWTCKVAALAGEVTVTTMPLVVPLPAPTVPAIEYPLAR
jgi:hypothetical protein